MAVQISITSESIFGVKVTSGAALYINSRARVGIGERSGPRGGETAVGVSIIAAWGDSKTAAAL